MSEDKVTATQATVLPLENGTVLLRIAPGDVLLWPDAVRVAAELAMAAARAAELVGAPQQTVREVMHLHFHTKED